MFEKFINKIDADDLITAIVIIICFCTFVVGCTHVSISDNNAKVQMQKYKCGDTHEEATEEKESEEN